MTAPQILLRGIAAIVLAVAARRAYLRAVIRQINPRELQELLPRQSDVVLLDVRNADERARGHIKGSLHLPVGDLLRRIETLEKHRSRLIVVYCQTGSRSLAAAATLRKHGFQVANLKGGMAEWNFSTRA